MNPANNRPITTVPAGDERDIDRAVAAAKEAFDKGPWRKMKVAERVEILERIADGTYGRCESCGQPIGKNRLMAFPRATLGLSCKQREERR